LMASPPGRTPREHRISLEIRYVAIVGRRAEATCLANGFSGSSDAAGDSPDPDPRVAEEAHPGAVLAPLLRRPAELDGAEDALGVRHEDRRAAVGTRESRHAERRAAGIERVDVGVDGIRWVVFA